jgi:hypothetical protein
MPANLSPIFPLVPNVSWVTLTAANTATNGTGTVGLLFTCGADGARLDHVVCKALGTNVATIARFFLNNGGVPTTPENNSLIHEQLLPATSASNVALLSHELIVPVNRSLPPNARLYAVIATAVSAGWQFTAFGGNY